MQLFVCIKQVPATETKIKINAQGNGIDETGIKWILSPYDEYAIEEAIRFKEKNSAATVTVLSVGPQRVTEGLRTALAMGCDQAIWIEGSADFDSSQVAACIAKAIQKTGAPHLVFMGKQAIDDDCAQVGPLTARALDIPYASVVLKIEYLDAEKIKVHRETEGGSVEVIETQLPALISTQKGLNEPRFASLPNIMKAKKKEIQSLKAMELGVTESDRKLKHKNYRLPPAKPAGKKIDGTVETQVKELVRLLKEEAKIL